MMAEKKEEEEIFIPGEKEIKEAEKIERELAEKALDIFKEEVRKMPEEKREELAEDFEKRLEEMARKWPEGLLSPAECDLLVENWAYLTSQGWGDIREGMKSAVYREAVKGLDFAECEELYGEDVPVVEIPKTVSSCLALKIEDLVKQKLIDDGWDEEKVRDSNLYWNTPLDWDWTSDDEQLAEAGRKILDEE